VDFDNCWVNCFAHGHLGLVAGTTGWQGVVDPWWHAVMKIVVGLVAVAIGFMDKIKF